MSFIYNIVKGLSKLTASYKEPYPDIHMLDFRIVNSFIVGNVQMRKYDWVIVDAGIDNSGRMIVKALVKTVRDDRRPEGGHPHSWSLRPHRWIEKILSRWNVPVYAHPAEIPI